MSTLVVVPTFNEATNLPRLVSTILSTPAVSVLVVDDNSPDGTGEIADELARVHPGWVSVLHRPAKSGLGTAYVEGFRAALRTDADFIVQMDADFSHDPADIDRLVAAARLADVAIGSRYVQGGGAENWPLLRLIVSRGGSLYIKIILGLPVQDPTSGFKCFRREALASVDLDRVQARGFGFQVELNWLCHRLGLRLVEVPIRFVDRQVGQSKMSRQIFIEALWLVWALRRRGSGYPKSPSMTAS
jgi:dolichol-phosphate mannosyltransferase